MLNLPPRSAFQDTHSPAWRELRGEFPFTQSKVYLRTASSAPGTSRVSQATHRFLEDWSDGAFQWAAWEAEAELARQRFAEIVQARPQEISLVPAASFAAAQVAQGLTWRSGDNLVVGAQQFRSNLFPWLQLAQKGVEVREVEPRGGRHLAEDICAAMDSKTRLVAVSAIQSMNGHRIELEQVLNGCKRYQALTFVDATQQVGALRFDARPFDFVAVAAYKWLLNPRGASYLYVKEEHLDKLEPIAPGWKSHPKPNENYYGGPLEHADTARRFDLSLAWPIWVGAAAALELITHLGVENIERRNLALAGAFCEALGLPAPNSPIVGVEFAEPKRVEERLLEENIYITTRGSFARFAIHFFNDFEELDRVVSLLSEEF